MRATFGIGVLTFVLGTMAMRYYEASFLAYPGGDPWMVGDWLINYGGGFVRRGLFGELFLTFVPPGMAGLWILFAFQFAIYLGIYAYCLSVMHATDYSWSSIAIVCGPAALAFAAYTPSPDAAFRKELLSYATLLLLAVSRSPRRGRVAFVLLTVAALGLYGLAVFSWEASALLLPAVAYLLIGKGHPQHALGTYRWSAAVVFAVVAGVGAILSTLMHGDVATADAICASARERGYTGMYVCSGGVDASGGAIEAIGWTSYKTTQDLAIAVPVYVGYMPLIALSFLPTVMARWFRRNWAWAVLLIVAVAPLYVIVTDYGRWTSIIVIALLFMVTATDPRDSHSPYWNWLGTLLYTSLWAMPHWMGESQLGGAKWPHLGLMNFSVQTAVDRVALQSDTVRFDLPGNPLFDHTAAFLFGSPSAVITHSWDGIQVALAHVSRGGRDLYQTLFFEAPAIPYDAAPTALLLGEPFHVLTPGNIDEPLVFVSWVSVLATALVLFRILVHLAARTVRIPLFPGRAVVLLLLALTSTFMWFPLLKAWDTGHLVTLVTLATTLALFLYLRGNHVAAGIALGVASLMQPFLALFAFWALVRRDWRLLAGTVGTTALGVAAALLRYGPSAFAGYERVLFFLGRHGESHYGNQSLLGLLHRSLATDDPLSAINGYPPFVPTVVAGYVVGVLLLVTLALITGIRSPGRVTTPGQDALDFGIALLCFSLVPPIVTEQDLAVLLPVYAVVAFAALRLRAAVAVPALVAAAASYLLLTAVWWPEALPLAAATGSLSLSYPLLGALLLLVSAVGIRYGGSPARRRASEGYGTARRIQVG